MRSTRQLSRVIGGVYGLLLINIHEMNINAEMPLMLFYHTFIIQCTVVDIITGYCDSCWLSRWAQHTLMVGRLEMERSSGLVWSASLVLWVPRYSLHARQLNSTQV